MEKTVLKLYIVGHTLSSLRAIDNIRNIFEHNLKKSYDLNIVDVLEKPAEAEADKIIATPTLIKESPPPIRRIIGDLSDKQAVLMGLDILDNQVSTMEAK